MVSRLVLLISILIGTQFIYKEYEDKNDFIKSAYPYEGNQYTKNNQFEKLKYEKNGVNYTVEIMKDTSNADAILFISRSNMFDLNFDDLSAAIIKVEGITNNFQNFYSYNGIPDFYASIFILDSNLKGDEKIELITKENLFTLEGKLK